MHVITICEECIDKLLKHGAMVELENKVSNQSLSV